MAEPSQIGKYTVVRRLGRGGMGTVYLARDPDLDRSVAIKVLRDPVFDEELLQRFFREARAAANLRHENIITIYDVGEHEHQPYMALEYVDGETLLDIIRNRPALPLAEKLSWVEQICAGLGFAHAAGIVHRDIKPANIMVDRRGVLRILDFGIARVEGSGMTGDGALIGTLNYMSPEQMLGRPVDYRSDIFAVGTLAYELITYNKAFPGTLDEGLLQKLPYEDPPPLSTFVEGLPEPLQGIVSRALAKRPEDRFQDLEEMRFAIRDVRRGLDPQLALETVLVTARRGRAKPTTTSQTERPEIAERRARQIRVHLDAARAALERQDLEGAIAACEDALTVAPDNADALALLDQIERVKQQRDQESRARRERERTVRQRVADADLKLSRGDVAGASETLAQALADDPTNAAGLALVPRVREAAERAGVALPEVVAETARGLELGTLRPAEEAVAAAPTVLVPSRQAAAAPAPAARGRLVLIASAAAALVAVAAGVWLTLAPDPGPQAPAPETATLVEAQPPEPPPAPAESVPPEIDSGAAAAPAANPQPPAPEPEPAPPPARPAAAVEPPRVAETPPAVEPPAPVDLIGPEVERVRAAYIKTGDVSAALKGIQPLYDTSNDARVRDFAETLAQAAMREMNLAVEEAELGGAPKLAAQAFASAEQARTRAQGSLAERRYVEAGRLALTAAEAFRRASEAAGAAAKAPTAPASGGSPVSTASNAPAAAATPATATAAPPDPLEKERPGIMRTFAIYQSAYREQNFDLLMSIYPSMPREAQQATRRQFNDCRSNDVLFAGHQPALLSPTTATVYVSSTYICQPPTGQAEKSEPIQEVFQLYKVGNDWLIENTFFGDDRRRR